MKQPKVVFNPESYGLVIKWERLFSGSFLKYHAAIDGGLIEVRVTLL